MNPANKRLAALQEIKPGGFIFARPLAFRAAVIERFEVHPEYRYAGRGSAPIDRISWERLVAAMSADARLFAATSRSYGRARLSSSYESRHYPFPYFATAWVVFA
ncbi:hypothetical protein [Thiocystis violacea]|uniref:hypothetical protein n=1 Tax=Thiocystis violacea TaxID=13725 RepID=UPI001903E98C|nr:hypothetical protein [Thiocystis violacea]MBK1716901.1 hypothetical protein [Thiocystis violacea]